MAADQINCIYILTIMLCMLYSRPSVIIVKCVVSKNYLACEQNIAFIKDVGSSTRISKGAHAVKGFVKHTTTGCCGIAVQQ